MKTNGPTFETKTGLSVSRDLAVEFARAEALGHAGRLAEAEQLYRVLVSAFPDQPILLHKLAFIAAKKGEMDEADHLLRRAIAIAPCDPSFHNNLGNILRAKNGFAEAEACYRRAIQLQHAYQEAWYNLGLVLEEQGRTEEAMKALRQAVSLMPSDAEARTRIAAILHKHNAFDEALLELDRALAAQPNYFDAHYLRGLVLSMLERYEDAKAALKYAASLRPDSSGVIGHLALIAARNLDTDNARFYAAQCIERDPNQCTAIIALALLDLEEHAFTAAELRLRPLLASSQLDDNMKALAFGLLGDALDGQNRYTEAFEAYREKNQTLRLTNARLFEGKNIVEIPHRIISWFKSTSATSWCSPSHVYAGDNQISRHVFLLGFMRSGTTLLEQVLATHPSVVTLEERELLGDTAQIFLTNKAGFNRLAVLDNNDLVHYRNAYWQRVRDQGLDVSGKVFVDKQPLNTINLPLIAKLFPNAKILFAIRDPRDVVLSCYRRHFGINRTTFELLSLEGAARFYDAVMTIGQLCFEKLPLAIYRHHYETMIVDFDREISAVCRFIGLEWSEEMRNFKDHPRSRSIRSLSSTQVRRGLYREGVGQWQRYENELSPILPLLQPWVEAFGYECTGGSVIAS